MSAPDAETSALLEKALAEGLELIGKARDAPSLEDARVRSLGRKASLARARSSLGRMPEVQRRSLGAIATSVQRRLEEAYRSRKEAFDALNLEKRWQEERIDVTLPGENPPVGGLHPLTKTIWEIVDIFIGMGYRVAEGPEVELASYNFDALNTPYEHPSRSPSDTYYMDGQDENVLLRPHTSPVQIRAMETQEPPVYIVCPGRTYRRDEIDATHMNTFAQIEGLAVDEGVTMADLKGTLGKFARTLFGKDLDVRLRPSFFPFTEPSAEMDVECFVCRGNGCRVCKQEGWIELLGCGMVDPFVLEWVGYDVEKYSGFAFGLGAERAASLAHGVSDLRYFYENDIRFLQTFRGVS
ncbi:MAG: phenylalanine--tRNA ligase subunit alpha [Actinobacteria bacterium]|nr:phenylalanine--tRNA ligase subunit alpha [Actinomycetota bacterium]